MAVFGEQPIRRKGREKRAKKVLFSEDKLR